MTMQHPSYTLHTSNPVDIDGIQWEEWRTLNAGRYVWIDTQSHLLVKPTKYGSTKTWTAIRWSTISKQQITVGTQYRSRDAAMRACINAAFGAHRG